LQKESNWSHVPVDAAVVELEDVEVDIIVALPPIIGPEPIIGPMLGTATIDGFAPGWQRSEPALFAQ
jgi:hypothetical protein